MSRPGICAHCFHTDCGCHAYPVPYPGIVTCTCVARANRPSRCSITCSCCGCYPCARFTNPVYSELHRLGNRVTELERQTLKPTVTCHVTDEPVKCWPKFTCDFAWALGQLKDGNVVRRKGWSKYTYVYKVGAVINLYEDGGITCKGMYAFGQDDLLADDWEQA